MNYSPEIKRDPNYHFFSGNRNTNILSIIDNQNSYNLLAGRGLSKTDSFITRNFLSYDLGDCAQMRISRPFSANIKWDSFYNSGYVLHIDKVEFDGYVIQQVSPDLYFKLMSYRSEDRDNKLLSNIDRRNVLAKLSIKPPLNKPTSVFVPRHLKIFDSGYHRIEPSCFFERDY